MGFKMKSSPYGEKRSGEMDMKPRMSSNFDKSGMKNADGSSIKPGAPGMFGRIAKGVLTGGMSEIGNLFKKKNKSVDPNAQTPPVDPNAAAPPVDPNAAAPPAGVAPTDPTLAAAPVDPNATPMPMRKNKKY